MGKTLISYQKILVISPKSTYTQTIKFTQLHTYLHICIHMHKQVHTNIYLYVITRNNKEKKTINLECRVQRTGCREDNMWGAKWIKK